jgi:hypothetical protein
MPKLHADIVKKSLLVFIEQVKEVSNIKLVSTERHRQKGT